jgi:hypothetical protein
MKTHRHLSALPAVIFFITLSLFCKPALLVQNNNKSKVVSGKITSQTDDAIVGASIQLNGSPLGTSSDEKGGFTVTVEDTKSISCRVWCRQPQHRK